MRIVVADTIYPAFYERLYRERPGLADQPYADQLRVIWDQCFGTADAYVRHLRALGHDAVGVIANCVPLQLAWLREHRVPRSLSRPAIALPGRPGVLARLAIQSLVLMAQVERLRPDVLFVHDLWLTGRRELDWLRARVPILVGQIASAPPPLDRMRRFDLVLSSFPHFVDWFRREGIDSEPFRLAFYEHVADRLREDGIDPSSDAPGRSGVVLVGGLSPRVYPTATPMLEQLCAAVDVDVWGYGQDELSPSSPILRRFHGAAWGLEMYRILARARVVVNRHGDVARGYANTMRLYEATGVGAVLMTEQAPNLGEMFSEDEVVVYASGDELADRTRALLADDDAARSIAGAGQARTLREHTYAERMGELAALLEARTPRSIRRR